ncbi:NAD-dependent protein deacylase [Clostridium botulinum]|uniref:NAD-dependent protein deacetylase n=1 Tax=Clostridium botulinum CFSAN001627 TaxID=1232189 RepID=M1ZV31_CLOBO|nr:NAD-dependent protein deacylase [Clostridium botulinum]EKN43331.1 NAD-dependent deacetylase [Clostridium botulinum CFSAN001627]APC81296.1 sir2 family protein [Clostridium botulinum]APC84757.1 sir2 family protein [Clostridium botulinum]APQ77962.1 sir2 family protein [Clostridium botulinum]AUM97558.1 NAD-dependent protein deacylase [Clostridium botulinum]
MRLEKLKHIIDNSENIVFLGGAGVSTESNIPDFRSNNGLYKSKNNLNYSPETILSHSFFKNNTKEFFQFYKDKMIFKDAKPNLAHYALTELEQIGKLKAIITQNIDGLHQLSGAKNVLELHGSVHRNYCVNCGEKYNLDYILNTENSSEDIPHCKKCGSIVRPDVVLYEEGLDMDTISKAVYYIQNADVLIVGGTSLVVYPAAGLVNYYKGKKLVLINKAETPYDKKADLVIHDSIGSVLEKVIKRN